MLHGTVIMNSHPWKMLHVLEGSCTISAAFNLQVPSQSVGGTSHVASWLCAVTNLLQRIAIRIPIAYVKFWCFSIAHFHFLQVLCCQPRPSQTTSWTRPGIRPAGSFTHSTSVRTSLMMLRYCIHSSGAISTTKRRDGVSDNLCKPEQHCDNICSLSLPIFSSCDLDAVLASWTLLLTAYGGPCTPTCS